DTDHVDRLVVEDPAEVLLILGRLALALLRGGHGRTDDHGIDVADDGHFAVMLAGVALSHVRLALAAHADHRDAQAIVGSPFLLGSGFFGGDRRGARQPGGGQRRGESGGVVEEVSAVHGTHESVPATWWV